MTADELDDPGDLALRLRLSGEPLAEGRTRELAIPLAELLALASRAMTLEPGDVVLTGPPLSWNAGPLPRPLCDGDVVQLEIEGVGRLASYVQLKSS